MQVKNWDIFLRGDLEEKVNPYMMALFGAIEKCVGAAGPDRERVDACLELSPLAFMRGSTFDNAICILDEAQNATFSQLKLFVTRLGENSKMIINGDPEQSDLLLRDFAIDNFVDKVEFIEGIGIMEFDESDIVRHPLVSKILKELAR